MGGDDALGKLVTLLGLASGLRAKGTNPLVEGVDIGLLQLSPIRAHRVTAQPDSSLRDTVIRPHPGPGARAAFRLRRRGVATRPRTRSSRWSGRPRHKEPRASGGSGVQHVPPFMRFEKEQPQVVTFERPLILRTGCRRLDDLRCDGRPTCAAIAGLKE